jgi:hypothetical protein
MSRTQFNARMEGAFASRLRALAVANGYATLVDVVSRLVGAVSRAAAAGQWETAVGPFVGVWHGDEGGVLSLVLFWCDIRSAQATRGW